MMHNPSWAPGHLRDLLIHTQEHPGNWVKWSHSHHSANQARVKWQYLCGPYGNNTRDVQQIAKDLGIVLPTPSATPAPGATAAANGDLADVIQMVKHLTAGDSVRVISAVTQAQIRPVTEDVVIQIPDDPFYLTAFGDFHLESLWADMEKLHRDLEYIRDKPGLYAVFVGDGTDNPIKHRGSSFDAVCPPSLARKAFVEYIGVIQAKLVGLVTGCHEKFAQEMADYNVIEELSQRLKIPYLGYGGRVVIHAAGTPVVVSAAHKGLGTSYMNDFHPCVRQIRERDQDADVVAVAHNHISGIAIQEIAGKQRVLIRSGAYKVADRFAQHLGFRPLACHLKTPVVKIWAKERRFKILDDISMMDDE